MFDNAYPFTFRFNKKYKDNGFLKAKSTYAFRTEKEAYLIECEEYSQNIYVIKFFPRRLKNNTTRFNILTNEHKVGRIVKTCIDVMVLILEENPNASFGFIGSHTLDPERNYEERKDCTKRFKIYRYAVFNLIGEKVFSHFMEEKNSTFLLVNNKNSDIQQIKSDADKMFEKIFPMLNEN